MLCPCILTTENCQEGISLKKKKILGKIPILNAAKGKAHPKTVRIKIPCLWLTTFIVQFSEDM